MIWEISKRNTIISETAVAVAKAAAEGGAAAYVTIAAALIALAAGLAQARETTDSEPN